MLALASRTVRHDGDKGGTNGKGVDQALAAGVRAGAAIGSLVPVRGVGPENGIDSVGSAIGGLAKSAWNAVF